MLCSSTSSSFIWIGLYSAQSPNQLAVVWKYTPFEKILAQSSCRLPMCVLVSSTSPGTKPGSRVRMWRRLRL
jgi:hypothetical protein